jgi:hypothetical protein
MMPRIVVISMQRLGGLLFLSCLVSKVLSFTTITTTTTRPILPSSTALRFRQHHHQQDHPHHHCRDDSRTSSSSMMHSLSASPNPTNEPQSQRKRQSEQRLLGRKEGVYTRPSGAIERGSGFYVPGLEGPKVRLVFGGLLLVVLAANHVISNPSTAVSSTSTSTSLSPQPAVFVETLSFFYAALVLLQGVVQYRRDSNKATMMTTRANQQEERWRAVDAEDEEDGGNDDSNDGDDSNYLYYQQVWSVVRPAADDDQHHPRSSLAWQGRVEWAARTLTALTPATHVLLVAPDSVLFSHGRRSTTTTRQVFWEAAEDDDVSRVGLWCDAVTSTMAQSTTGRLALPPTHPIVQQLLQNMNDNDADAENDDADDGTLLRQKTTRTTKTTTTVLLQRVTATMCLVVVAVDQRLAAYQSTDLEWLGRLAAFVAVHDETSAAEVEP